MLRRVEDEVHRFPHWRVEDGLLYKHVRTKSYGLMGASASWKLVVPRDCRTELLYRYHDDKRAGHVGIYKVYWRLREQYIWPGMHADVARYVRRCTTCAQQKPEQKAPAGLMGTRPDVNRPWQTISLDFVGPLPRSSKGNTSLLVVSDYFSKYVLLFALKSATAKALSRLLEDHVFLVYGVPQYIICDNGVQMRSKDFRGLCETYGVRVSYTPLYAPHADPAERVNRVVKTMMGCYVKDNQRKWDDHLAPIGCAIRASRSEATGHSPFLVNFGRPYVGNGKDYAHELQSETSSPSVPQRVEGFRQLLASVREKLTAARERGRKVYNLRRRPVQYEAGQYVWRRNKILSSALNYMNAKLAAKFVGPFRVKRRMGSLVYELEDERGVSKGVWHVQDLKPVQGCEDGDS